MKRFSLLLILLMGILYAGAAVPADTAAVAKKKPINVKKSLRQARKRIKGGNTYDASDMFVQVLAADSTNMKVAYQLATNYYHERDYKKAELWFTKVCQRDLKEYPLSSYWLGLMMKMNGKYEEAKKQLNSFIQTYKGSEASKYKRWAKVDADGCDLALALKKTPLNLEVLHLDANVNSPYSDVSPMLWNDTTLLYGSLPVDTIIRISKADTSKKNNHFVHFYSATGTPGDYKNKTPFPQFNEEGEHSGNGAYSPDKKRFYYTLCEQDEKNKIRCAIYVSHLSEGQWLPGVKLPTEINLPDYTSTHPNIGKDGKGHEVLFYVSDRPGGKGGMDIWYAYLKGDNATEAPKNAGKINTDRDEGTPFYDLANDSLYYSSQGFAGMGGYDIFRVGGTLGKWSEPVNVGYPVNSQTDDMYYRRNDDNKSGFFVSNRPGIISIRSETCCDDIFAYIPPRQIFVRGYVLEKGTDKKLDNSPVALSNPINPPKGGLALQDTTRNGQMFFFKIDFNNDYKLDGTHSGYFPGSATFTTQGLTKSDTLRQDIYLEKLVVGKAYRLKNVYYDYDQWALRDEAKRTLDTLYDILKANPLIIVELGSHTDSRATHNYNTVLSQHRAESCVEYLLSKGIPLERLRARGYGETELLEDCSGFADCPTAGPGDCPCHQLNRRTEFKIVGELDAPLEYTDKRYSDLAPDKRPAPVADSPLILVSPIYKTIQHHATKKHHHHKKHR